MTDQPFLSVVVPAYNEIARLPTTLHRIHVYCLGLEKDFELLVVDDGSTDGTPGLVQSLQAEMHFLKLISYSRNHGKGYAIKEGVHHARGKYILFSDADLSTPIEEFSKFLPLLQQGIPIVIATRKHKEAKILRHQPLWREYMGKAFTSITNAILGMHISDYTCGFKAFDHAVAKEIFGDQKIEGWAFDAEILFLAARRHYAIVEVPVQWINAPQTKVRLVRDTISSFLSLLRIRWNELNGKYAQRAPDTTVRLG